ncbi:hypothetical protein MHYP_G00267440 [Metynnis hypsauchen]
MEGFCLDLVVGGAGKLTEREMGEKKKQIDGVGAKEGRERSGEGLEGTEAGGLRESEGDGEGEPAVRARCGGPEPLIAPLSSACQHSGGSQTRTVTSSARAREMDFISQNARGDHVTDQERNSRRNSNSQDLRSDHVVSPRTYQRSQSPDY